MLINVKIMLVGSIIGNLGADARRIEGPNFRPFYNLSVAHTEHYKNASGVRCERTTWCNVVINWDCSALLPYLTRGAKVFAQGRVKLRAFVSQSGEPGCGIDIVADTLELCGSPSRTNSPENSPKLDDSDNEEDAEPF